MTNQTSPKQKPNKPYYAWISTSVLSLATLSEYIDVAYENGFDRIEFIFNSVGKHQYSFTIKLPVDISS